MYSTVRFSRSIRERDGFFRSTGIWIVFSIRRESPVSIFPAYCKNRNYILLSVLSAEECSIPLRPTIYSRHKALCLIILPISLNSILVLHTFVRIMYFLCSECAMGHIVVAFFERGRRILVSFGRDVLLGLCIWLEICTRVNVLAFPQSLVCSISIGWFAGKARKPLACLRCFLPFRTFAFLKYCLFTPGYSF